MRFRSVDRLCEPGDVGDHVWVVDRVHGFPVAGVERVVALGHELEQVSGRLLVSVVVAIAGSSRGYIF